MGINKGVVRSVIEKIRLCRDRGYARYIPPLKVRGQLNVLNSGGLTCRGKEYSRCIRCIDIDRVETDHFNDREKECTVHQPYFSKLKKDPSSPNKFVLCGRG